MSNLRDELNAGQYEKTPEGILFPKSNLLAKGIFSVCKRGEEEELSENLVVDEGLNYFLTASMIGGSGIANWYIAPFSGDVTVLSTWTAANFTANATEWDAYTNGTRPPWVPGAVSAGGIDSFATKASFESNADTQIVRGAALISASAKLAVSGTLVAATRFPSDKNLDTGEILDVGYGLQLTAV